MLCRLQFWRGCVFIQGFAAAVDRTERWTGPEGACRPAAERWTVTPSWLARPPSRAQDQDPCLPSGAAQPYLQLSADESPFRFCYSHQHLSADERGLRALHALHAIVVQAAKRNLLVLSQHGDP